MSIWNVITAANAVSIDSNLDEIKAQNEAIIRQQEQANQLKEEKEIATELCNLFQELYNNNNDINAVSLSNITNINNHINKLFNNRKNIIAPTESSESIVTIVLVLIVFFGLLSFGPKPIAALVEIIIAGALLYVPVMTLINIEQQKNEYINNNHALRKHIPELKSLFPTLSAYGIFKKWYIDSKLNNILKILNNKDDNKNVLDTLQTMYQLFELNIGVNLNYNWNLVSNFNSELIKEYDNTSN
jgi:ABC-type transport system involved in cytochrome bd biosynthesis fused ATPase/permease subunit